MYRFVMFVMIVGLIAPVASQSDTVELPDGLWLLQDGKGADTEAGIVSVLTAGADMNSLGLKYVKAEESAYLFLHVAEIPNRRPSNGTFCTVGLGQGLSEWYFDADIPHVDVSEDDGSFITIPVPKTELRSLCRSLMVDNYVTVTVMLINPNTGSVNGPYMVSFDLPGSSKAIDRWAQETAQDYVLAAVR